MRCVAASNLRIGSNRSSRRKVRLIFSTHALRGSAAGYIAECTASALKCSAIRPRWFGSVANCVDATNSEGAAKQSPSILRACLHADAAGVAVHFGDGGSAKFHAIWLRDHCRCAQCTHPGTKQRLVDTLAIPSGIRPSSASVVDGGRAVRVEWSDGPGLDAAPLCGGSHKVHVSIFPAEWLAAHTYAYGGTASSAAEAVRPSRPLMPPASPHVPANDEEDHGQRRGQCQYRHHDPVASLSSRTAWTAAHFGSRSDADDARGFPSVPYHAFMGSFGSGSVIGSDAPADDNEHAGSRSSSVAASQSGSGSAAGSEASADEEGAPAAAVQPGEFLPYAFSSAAMLPGTSRELRRHEAAASRLHCDAAAIGSVEAFLAGLSPVARARYEGVLSGLRQSASSSASAAASASLAAASASFLGLHRALALLHRYGFVRIEGVPASEAATEAACRRIAALRGTLYGEGMWRTEVLPGGGNDTAYSTIPLPAHVDGCYMSDPPGLQAFHCLRADPTGGHTLLVDGLAVAESLRAAHPDTFNALAATPLQYHHTDSVHQLRAWHTPIALDPLTGAVTGIRFNNDDRAPVALPSKALGDVPVSMPALYVHIRRMLAALRSPAHELWMPLRPGTLLIFDNQRILHGRSGFSGASGRILSGAYVGRDEWQSRFRSVTRVLS